MGTNPGMNDRDERGTDVLAEERGSVNPGSDQVDFGAGGDEDEESAP
jgi:hypothetical protein